MGCKFGGDQKEEEKNELNTDVDAENNGYQSEEIHNLDYYMKKFDSDEKE